MSSEKRVDPDDGAAYTYDELAAFYKGKFKKADIGVYWENQCTPIKKSKNGKKVAEPKAKAKVKAKAEPKERGPANPKRFINAEADIVQECIDGLVWSTPNLGRMDTYPAIKVVFRSDWNKDKVAIISGGGAGHEPMHGGFVGKGMLTAAVSGETFASPTIDAVLSAIVQVTGPKGCLLVIKNYTGDRLNFTLAAQRARSMYGLDVRTVITKDDVATVAERGIAGTLFVHKVCGAMAEAGKSLDEVEEGAKGVISHSASMGVSFSSVRRLKAEMIGLEKMEVGLGIHGEAGIRVEDKATADKIVDILMEGILKEHLTDAPNGFACLLNNLGSVPPQEMCILANALRKSKWADKIKLLVGPAQLCTSLDMNGVSISLLRLAPGLDFDKYLTADTAVPAWPQAVTPSFPTPVPGIAGLDPMEGVVPSSDAKVMAALEKICKVLVESKKMLDDLDAKVGDADCGSTMATAGKMMLDSKDKLPLADPKAACKCISTVLGKTMGGSSGVLLSIMFMGMSENFKEGQSFQDGGAHAFKAGLDAMSAAGGASKGSRTMLDALFPAAEALVAGKSLADAKAAAIAGAEATRDMVPKAGRSENVPASAYKGVIDPGAKAAALVFTALAS